MPIKRIFSAGGIIVKQNEPLRHRLKPKALSGKSGWEVLVTQHSGHKGWDFPKGHREIYESEEQTALREVEEEVGIKAEIIEKIGQTQYFYYEEGPDSAKASSGKEKVLKTVTFYLMKYISEGKATTAFEVSAKVWLPIDKVEEQLTFKDTKELWRRAKEKIEKLKI